MRKKDISLTDSLLLENYNDFTLPNKNELFSYDTSRLSQIEYINMHAELKNIYRSYIATKIITHPGNTKELLLSHIPYYEPAELLDFIIEHTKEGLKKTSYANIEHFLAVFKTFLALDLKNTLKSCRKHEILQKCGEVVENPSVQEFIVFLLTLPECDPENEDMMVRESLKSGVFKILCNTISLTRKPTEIDAETLKKTGLDSALVTQTLSSVSGTFFESTCTEASALAAFEVLYSLVTGFMDCMNESLKGTYPHECAKHVMFLEYFFGGDAMLLNSFFSAYIDKQRDENYVNLSIKCGTAINCIISFGKETALKKYEKDLKTVIRRFFPSVQRMLVDFLTYHLKGRKKFIENKEEEKQILSKTQLERRGFFENLLMETMVTICTKYDENYMKMIERSTWEAILATFLKFRKKSSFQMHFYRLLTTGFKLGVESVVLDIVLYQNMIGELWDIIQERERDLIIYKGAPHNEVFYNLSMHLVMLLESIESDSKTYRIMSEQFAFNMAWKRIKEYRNKDKEVPPSTTLTTCKGALSAIHKLGAKHKGLNSATSKSKGTLRVPQKSISTLPKLEKTTISGKSMAGSKNSDSSYKK